MIRPLAVIIGTVILLVAGFYLGSRPAARTSSQLARAKTEFQVKIAEFEARALDAETRSLLHQARAELFAAGVEVSSENYSEAAVRAKLARELITRASARPGMHLDTSDIVKLLEAGLTRIEGSDPGAGDPLSQAADQLGSLMDRKQA